MKTIVKEDLVSDEVALRLHNKGIQILSDHTIIYERGSHTLEYYKPTQSQLKKYLSQNYQIFVNTMPDLSVNEVQGFDVYVSSFNFPKKIVGFKRTEEDRLRSLIGALFPSYFLEKDFDKLKTIFIAGKVYGIQIASKVIDGNYHKDEAKDELIELIERTVEAKQLKNFIEQPPK